VILVTGATGFLGRLLVGLLRERGDSVRALGRDEAALEQLAGLGAETARVTIDDREGLRRTADGCELVFHVAGLVAHEERDRRRLMATNADGTRMLLDAVDPAARVIHVASVATLGPGTGPEDIITEGHTPPPDVDRLPYSASKIAGERYALEAARSGRDVVVVNPSYVIGPGDERGGTTWPIREYLRGRMRFLIAGGLCAVDARDVAAGALAAAERGKAGQRYILGTPDGNLSHREFFKAIGDVAGKRRAQLMLPHRLAFALMTIFPWPVTPGYARVAAEYWYCDPAKAMREIGYAPRPLGETLADTVHDVLARLRR